MLPTVEVACLLLGIAIVWDVLKWWFALHMGKYRLPSNKDVRVCVCVCVCVYRYSKRFSFDELIMFRYIASKQSLVPGDLSPHLSSSLGSFQARYAFCQVCFLGFRLRWSRGCQRLEWSWHQRRPWLFPVIWKRDAVFTYLLERLNKLFSSGCLGIFRQVGFSIFQNSSFRMRRPLGVSVCLRWKATQDIRRRRWHHSQSPLTITPQCVIGVGPDLVTPSVGYNQSESDERAFSRM